MPNDDRDSLGQSALRAMNNRIESKLAQTLMGMVTGIVADGSLHDREIALRSTWLRENDTATMTWPGAAIAAQVRKVLADGLVTEEERTHLLSVLSEMSNSDFTNTGAVTPEPIKLPIDDTRELKMQYAGIVHTGTFLYGTRAACERLSMALGAVPMDNVTRGTDILVVGTRVTPTWFNESYGRKIMKGAEMRDSGHHICIVSERKWFEHATAAGAGVR